MLTALQKKTSQAIVNIFETGKPLGDYGCVSVLNGDTGHLTYGRSQTTLASGNLALLLYAYCDSKGQFSTLLKPYLPAFERLDFSLDQNERVKSLLRQAGNDPLMKKIQNEFFDRVYWEPALKAASYLKISRPLGVTVIYDSKIHGSFERIRDRVVQQYGGPSDVGEEKWIETYVSTRRDWLANHSNVLLHRTVYRMDSFKEMIDTDKWELPLPLTIRNVVINEEIFDINYKPPVTASATDPVERVLFFTRPMMRSNYVKKLQKALNFPEEDIDGIFGKKTDRAVRRFQKAHGLRIDGKVGPATRAALGY
jgi:chitosanase